jgi:hypothetical protein
MLKWWITPQSNPEVVLGLIKGRLLPGTHKQILWVKMTSIQWKKVICALEGMIPNDMAFI